MATTNSQSRLIKSIVVGGALFAAAACQPAGDAVGQICTLKAGSEIMEASSPWNAGYVYMSRSTVAVRVRLDRYINFGEVYNVHTNGAQPNQFMVWTRDLTDCTA